MARRGNRTWRAFAEESFPEEIRPPHSQLWRWCHGVGIPSASWRLKLERWSDGEISVEDWEPRKERA